MLVFVILGVIFMILLKVRKFRKIKSEIIQNEFGCHDVEFSGGVVVNESSDENKQLSLQNEIGCHDIELSGGMVVNESSDKNKQLSKLLKKYSDLSSGIKFLSLTHEFSRDLKFYYYLDTFSDEYNYLLMVFEEDDTVDIHKPSKMQLKPYYCRVTKTNPFLFRMKVPPSVKMVRTETGYYFSRYNGNSDDSIIFCSNANCCNYRHWHKMMFGSLDDICKGEIILDLADYGDYIFNDLFIQMDRSIEIYLDNAIKNKLFVHIPPFLTADGTYSDELFIFYMQILYGYKELYSIEVINLYKKYLNDVIRKEIDAILCPFLIYFPTDLAFMIIDYYL